MERGAPVTTPGGGMTREEARAEARKRWGGNGQAFTVGAKPLYWVGDGILCGATEWGSGESWEAAFADADRRAKGVE